ncbi:hypothetical protein BsWGS_12016 [Bradybaena similaris]
MMEVTSDESNNTVDSVWGMSSLKTLADENSHILEMSSIESKDEMNTLQAVESEWEMGTLNTVEPTCQMNTLGATCEMNTQGAICEMNTLGATCEMDTQGTTCEMNTQGGTCEMNTQGATCEMNTQGATCEMNTQGATCEMNTQGATCEMNTQGATCEMNTLGVTCEMNTLGATCEMNTLKTKNSLKVTASGDTNNDPPCKKARLELHDPGRDLPIISSQSVIDTGKNSAEKDKVAEDNAQPVSSVEHNGTGCKPCDAEDHKTTDHSSSERPSPLTEIQAGITEYLGSHKGFSAIIKQRYSDFIVNEIDRQGNLVHLTQMNLDNLDEEPVEESKQDEDKISTNVISDEDVAKLEDLVKNGDKKASVNIIAPADKESRTKIHLAVKNTYEQLETKTTDVDGQKVIQVIWKSGKSRGNNRDDWPQAQKDFNYVKFVLYKENKDTMDAIGLIANNLKLKENLFQYAGIKDKRAKTSQEITAYRIHPKKLTFMNKVLWNIGLGNFQYVKEPLKLGQLMGNQFTIVLRNVQAKSKTVDAAMSSLKTLGFVNYFGMQRFGTTSVPTHKVGCALLHSDWDKAVDLILMPRDANPNKDAFQKVWMETRDPVATLKVTPLYCGLERKLLEALKRKMTPFNALEKISRNIRLLYIHSYQALVWNKMVSKRLTVFGMKPIVGDLAMKDDSENTEKKTPIVVTEDNLDQFSFHDLVLPLPGFDVIYPKNEVHSWYRETLAEDGLDIDNMRRAQKDYSLPGAYRHMTVCPSNVTWSHHRYDDCSLPLTLSDMDVIKEVTLPASHNKGKFKAVILKMDLPSSCYATMALREVLHVDTSVFHQTSLNVT